MAGLLFFRTNNTTSNHYHHHLLLLLLTLTLLLLVESSSAFALHHPTNPQKPSSSSLSLIKNVNKNHNYHRRLLHNQHRSNSIIPSSSSSALLKIRGGSSSSSTPLQSMSSILSATSSAIQNGPYGILGLFGIASSVVVPLTMIRQGYSFSVGYGYSVMAMALTISQVFGIDLFALNSNPLSLLTAGVVFYGFRLGSFLLLREFTVASKRKQIKSFDKSPMLQRLPLALSVSLFYAFMTSPLMYAARYFAVNGSSALVGDVAATLFNIGVGLTWVGAIGETIADGQKFLVKRNVKEDESKFVGPTGGLYKLCRHPNYLFEVVHWFGLTLAGIVTFGGSTNKLAYVYASLGLYGIYSIMNGASKRLDTKQDENYNGQDSYEKYKSSVKGSLFPSI